MVTCSCSRVASGSRFGLLLGTILLIGLVGPAPRIKADEPKVGFEPAPDGLQITIDGQPFAHYVFESGETTRPFLEHLHAPDGTQVTRNNPPVEGHDLTDHPTFHPGLWLAFGDLNGADSWRNQERIRHAGFVKEPQGGPGRGTFAVRNRYEKGSTLLGAEVCRITVLVRPAGYLLLWDSEFHPEGGELVFGDQEEMGLGIRVATPLAVVKGGRILDSQGASTRPRSGATRPTGAPTADRSTGSRSACC